MTATAVSWWFTAAEIAALGMPGVPDSARRVSHWAAAEGWADRRADDGSPLARPRRARGGGTEYHVTLLPVVVQERLAQRQTNAFQLDQPSPIAANDTGDVVGDPWAWYGAQSARTKAEAETRLTIVVEVEGLQAMGFGKTGAIARVAKRRDVSPRAIAGWFALIAGNAPADRLPALAPRYQGGGRKLDIDAEVWRIFKSDYLRAEKPTAAACYRRLETEYAEPRGLTLPPLKTLVRRIEREVPGALTVHRRQGKEAVRKSVPPLKRSVADLHALQCVNVDGHTFDVFVQWEDGKIGRPVMVGTQDVHSRKITSHRIGRTESTLLTRLAFADLFRDHGIPPDAVMDNGRAFASKALTGGALTRFRFKIKDTDATGVLTALGVTVHWTLPYRGSSKPIERAWRDLCEDIAKHPRVAGAYTGNKPDAKPENYGTRAIPIAEFRAHVAKQIAEHNARTGRRTETARGEKSFDQVFAESYAVSPIRKASPEQLRIALLLAEERPCAKQSGAVTLAGNVFWHPDMVELAGKKVMLRFDPDNLHGGVHVYLRTGQYFCFAPVNEAVGFLDMEGAERRGKLEADLRKKVRAAEDAADLLRADELAALFNGTTPPAPAPEARVVQPVRHRGQTAAALKPIPQADPAPAQPDFTDNLMAGLARLRIVE